MLVFLASFFTSRYRFLVRCWTRQIIVQYDKCLTCSWLPSLLPTTTVVLSWAHQIVVEYNKCFTRTLRCFKKSPSGTQPILPIVSCVPALILGMFAMKVMPYYLIDD